MTHFSLSRRRFTRDSLVSLRAGASIEAIGCAQQQAIPRAVTRRQVIKEDLPFGDSSRPRAGYDVGGLADPRQTGSIAGPFDFLCSPEA